MSAIQSRRVYGLDILRAFAILLVLCGHSSYYLTKYVSSKYLVFIPDGVDLFFVLSGFLIGGILLKTIHSTDFKFKDLINFWIRRWFRTLPNYYFVLTVLFVYFYLRHITKDPYPIKYYLFIQCFHTPHPGFFLEAWSLAVEEWFYLMIPFGLFFLIHYLKVEKRTSIIFTIIFVIVSVTLFRIHRVVGHPYKDEVIWDINIRKEVITRLDSIMYGFLGAYLNYYGVAFWRKNKNLLFCIGIGLLYAPRFYVFFYHANIFYMNYIYLSLTAIGTLFLLPKLNTIKTDKGLVFRFLTFVSLISYSLYLLNLTPVLLLIIPRIFKAMHTEPDASLKMALISIALYWLISFGLSYLLYYFFETRITAIREKISRKEKGAL